MPHIGTILEDSLVKEIRPRTLSEIGRSLNIVSTYAVSSEQTGNARCTGNYDVTGPFCPIKILFYFIFILVSSRSCLSIDAASQPTDCWHQQMISKMDRIGRHFLNRHPEISRKIVFLQPVVNSTVLNATCADLMRVYKVINSKILLQFT